MVDCVEHLDAIESVLGAGASPVRVCIELDAGWWALGGRIKVGPKRSPVHTVEQAVTLAREIERRPQLELAALMAYEGQIAGVGDRPPGRRLRGAAIRSMQRRSAAELAERRAAVVAAIREFAELPIVNGGGTGSLELTGAEDAVTEIAAGSGFYAPTLFDPYSRFSLTPAAGFALPIVRKPSPAIATALGGGYLASGSGDPSRVPSPWLPPGLELDPEEGAGEVQTPLSGDPARDLRDRRPRLHAPRQGRRALRALRQPSTWSKARRSSTSSPPIAARDEPSSSRAIAGASRSLRSFGSGTHWSALPSPLFLHPPICLALARLRPEDALGVLVGEGVARVELLAGRLEVGPARVTLGQRRPRSGSGACPSGDGRRTRS